MMGSINRKKVNQVKCKGVNLLLLIIKINIGILRNRYLNEYLLKNVSN